MNNEGSGCSKYLGSAVLAGAVAIIGLAWAVYTFYGNSRDTQKALENQAIQIAQQQTQIALIAQQNQFQSQQLTLAVEQSNIQNQLLTSIPPDNGNSSLTATAVFVQASRIEATSQAIATKQKGIEATQTAVASQLTTFHPNDATIFGSHYYKVYTTKTISWSSAKSQCESQTGYLAVITSKGENDFVWSLAKKNSFPQYTVAWIGATDNSSEGNWKWVTNESFNALGNLVTNGSTYENYLDLRLATGQWEDFPLNGEQVGEQWYICEWG